MYFSSFINLLSELGRTLTKNANSTTESEWGPKAQDATKTEQIKLNAARKQGVFATVGYKISTQGKIFLKDYLKN